MAAVAFALLLGGLSDTWTYSAFADADRKAKVAEFKAMVDYLADPKREGRGPGTKGHDQARDYLVKQFESMGLRPVFKGKGDAGESYLQSFQIKLGVKAAKQSLTFTNDKGKAAKSIKAGSAFSTLGFSGSGKFDGPAVFVGYGIVNKDQNYDSFGGKKDALKGKIAVAFRYEPQDKDGKSKWTKGQRGQWTSHANLTTKAEQAAEHGAIALLLVNPPSQDDAVLRSTNRTAFGADAAIPVMHIQGSVLNDLLKRAGSKYDDPARTLQAMADGNDTQPIALDGVRVKGEVKLDRPKVTIHNVAAALPGRGPLANEVVVVGAHYDHIGYGDIGSRTKSDKKVIHAGADDNASGTAGLLMTASYFANKIEKDDADAKPRRTIVFAAFSGEERGLLGSKYMVTHLDEMGINAKQIAAMVNMDMIGRLRNETLFVFGVGSGDRMEAMVKAAAADSDLKLNTGSSAMGASDHASFFMQKVPAVHFFSGSHVDYHRPGDTADKINAEGGVRVIEIVNRLTESLAMDQQRLAFVPEKAPRHPGGASFGKGAKLGILPDYNTVDGTDGCGLDGVTAGGPAEKAGLKGGDVIVAWDGKKLNNIRHLMQFLGKHKGGDKVTLKVKRGDKTVDIKVELGSR